MHIYGIVGWVYKGKYALFFLFCAFLLEKKLKCFLTNIYKYVAKNNKISTQDKMLRPSDLHAIAQEHQDNIHIIEEALAAREDHNQELFDKISRMTTELLEFMQELTNSETQLYQEKQDYQARMLELTQVKAEIRNQPKRKMAVALEDDTDDEDEVMFIPAKRRTKHPIVAWSSV